jgi:hypothetical protein
MITIEVSMMGKIAGGWVTIQDAKSMEAKYVATSLSATGLAGIAASISCLVTHLWCPNTSSGPEASKVSAAGGRCSIESFSLSKWSLSSAIWGLLSAY